ncbi:MAG: adenosylcobinamide-GDP ribazoletransferase [Candidatus Bathyarchaeota archaeon]|nr:adenosylcobinamide-GDP ribazoletransferase [Candidatus Bathyarchaeota archaeon]
MKAIKTFRDLLSFLTIIPVGGKEDFIFTTASNMWLFPVIGGFIGLLAGLYYMASSALVGYLLNLATVYLSLPTLFLGTAIPAAMTLAFLLVITGLQHFDGLIDLGNALGLRNLHDRKMKAHAWTVSYAGAVLALAVEFLAFLGLFLINPLYGFAAIVLAEVSAKLSMVTIVWIGKPSHKGLGSIFLAKAKKPLNAAAYAFSALIVFAAFYFTGNTLLGLASVGLVFASVPVAFAMSRVSNSVFGGVSGDMIGATNEVARMVALLAFAGLLWGLTLW